jgi:hypothetical protein
VIISQCDNGIQLHVKTGLKATSQKLKAKAVLLLAFGLRLSAYGPKKATCFAEGFFIYLVKLFYINLLASQQFA